MVLVALIILLALLFDFINGMNDAANSIATVVSTRVLSPRVAVLWAAFFNVVAAFGFSLNVASTIGKGVIDVSIVDHWFDPLSTHRCYHLVTFVHPLRASYQRLARTDRWSDGCSYPQGRR